MTREQVVQHMFVKRQPPIVVVLVIEATVVIAVANLVVIPANLIVLTHQIAVAAKTIGTTADSVNVHTAEAVITKTIVVDHPNDNHTLTMTETIAAAPRIKTTIVTHHQMIAVTAEHLCLIPNLQRTPTLATTPPRHGKRTLKTTVLKALTLPVPTPTIPNHHLHPIHLPTRTTKPRAPSSSANNHHLRTADRISLRNNVPIIIITTSQTEAIPSQRILINLFMYATLQLMIPSKKKHLHQIHSTNKQRSTHGLKWQTDLIF